MYIDTHVHLNSDRFFEDYDRIISEANAAGVEKLIVIGYDKLSSKRALKIASEYPNVYASIGFHPTDISEISDEDYTWLEQTGKHKKVVAIGECGYDFHWKTTTPHQQKQAFKRQIEIAKRLNKPLVIHMRDASQLTLDTLIEYGAQSVGGVMHCYSGSYEMAIEFIKCNFYISLGGPVTFKNAVEAKRIASGIVLDRLLSETDSPYLAPHPHRGEINEPKYVGLVVQEIALLRNQPLEDVAKKLVDNAVKLFRLDQ